MVNSKKVRVDIILIFLAPFIICITCLRIFFNDVNMNYTELYSSATVISIGIIIECFTLREYSHQRSSDNGIISAAIVSLCIILTTLNWYFQVIFIFPRSQWQINFMLGLVYITIGTILRTLAKLHLGKYFSHKIQIVNTHQLITGGIYKYIRHPAYTGTVAIIIGCSTLFGTYLGFILVLMFCPLGYRRVLYEEKLLIGEFGNQYINYKKKVKRFIPYLF